MAAAETHDRRAAEDAVRNLAALPSSGSGADDTLHSGLGALRSMRWFDLLCDLTEAELTAGSEDPAVARLYAQALIDRGLVHAAIGILEPLVATLDPGSTEYAEARGLLARAHKQLMVMSRDAPEDRRRALSARAIEEYLDVYRSDTSLHTWHGVNAVALLAHRRRAGWSEPESLESIAGLVLSAVEAHDDPTKPNPWSLASALEACLALGRDRDALRWAVRYARCRTADAFELSATLRQLTEIWELDSTRPPGDEILPMLRAEALRRAEGTRVELGPDDLKERTGVERGLEKVLGKDGMVTYTWYRTGLERSRSVAQVLDDMEEPVGTGFLVAGSDLTPALHPYPVVFMTNHHVFGSGALPADRAIIRFQALEEDGESGDFAVARVLWTSPTEALDTTVAVLDRKVDRAGACPVAGAVPRNDGTQRVYVIGHPQGRSLSYAIDDNLLLDYDERVLHYRAPTEPGNSGSPVFNRSWQLIGIHHAGRSEMPRLHGGGTYPANEGVRLDAIAAALAASS